MTEAQPPTPEQEAVLDWLRHPQPVDGFVLARAGTGKTTLLTMCAQTTKGSPAAFVAFNRSIAGELSIKLRPHAADLTASSVYPAVSTLHGLGLRICRTQLACPVRIVPSIYQRRVRRLLKKVLREDAAPGSPGKEHGPELTELGRQILTNASKYYSLSLLDSHRANRIVEAAPVDNGVAGGNRGTNGPLRDLLISYGTSAGGLGAKRLHRFTRRVKSLADRARLGLSDYRCPRSWQVLDSRHPLKRTERAATSDADADTAIAVALSAQLIHATKCRALRKLRAQSNDIRNRTFHLDFTDMIWLPTQMKALAPIPEALRFRWLFVDEAQDLSRAAITMLRMLRAPKVGRMLAVGDPNQAIYGFAGADPDALMSLLTPAENNGRQTRPFPLTRSFRCPRSHLELARRLVPDITPQPGALEGSVRYIDKSVLAQILVPGVLVLGRTNRQLRRVEQLIMRGEGTSLPVVWLGRGAYGTNVAEQAECFIRQAWSESPSLPSSAFWKQVRFHCARHSAKLRRFKVSQAQALFQDIELNDEKVRDLRQRLARTMPKGRFQRSRKLQPVPGLISIEALAKMLERLRGRAKTLEDQIQRIAKEDSYLNPHLTQPTVEIQQIRGRLGELIECQRSLRHLTLRHERSERVLHVIDWGISRLGAGGAYSIDEDAVAMFANWERKLIESERQCSVTLATIHKAKGCEQDRVVLLAADDLPSLQPGQPRWQSQEEWNLLYVALTRAKAELILVCKDGRPGFTAKWEPIGEQFESFVKMGSGTILPVSPSS